MKYKPFLILLIFLSIPITYLIIFSNEPDDLLEDESVLAIYPPFFMHPDSPYDEETLARCGKTANALAQSKHKKDHVCFKNLLDGKRAQVQQDFFKARDLLHEGKCQEFFTHTGRDPNTLETDSPLLYAQLSYHGICLTQDRSKARDIWQKDINSDYPNWSAFAGLSALYWHGEAVEKDQDLARHYAKRATIYGYHSYRISLPQFTERNQVSNFSPHLKSLWNMSAQERLIDFVYLWIGPWDLPPPLKEQHDFLETLLHEDDYIAAEGFLEAAKTLRHSKPESPFDYKMEFRMAERAARYRKCPPAMVYFAKILEEKRLSELGWTWEFMDLSPEEEIQRKKASDRAAVRYITDAANAGYTPALNELYIRMTQHTPPECLKDEGWQHDFTELLLKMKESGLSISSQDQHHVDNYIEKYGPLVTSTDRLIIIFPCLSIVEGYEDYK